MVVMLTTAAGMVSFNSFAKTRTVSSALGAALGLLVAATTRAAPWVRRRLRVAEDGGEGVTVGMLGDARKESVETMEDKTPSV